MTPIIILVYYQNEYLKIFLNNLFKSNLGTKFRISVVENISDNTNDSIRPYLKKILSEKKIYRYILFKEKT